LENLASHETPSAQFLDPTGSTIYESQAKAEECGVPNKKERPIFVAFAALTLLALIGISMLCPSIWPWLINAFIRATGLALCFPQNQARLMCNRLEKAKKPQGIALLRRSSGPAWFNEVVLVGNSNISGHDVNYPLLVQTVSGIPKKIKAPRILRFLRALLGLTR